MFGCSVSSEVGSGGCCSQSHCSQLGIRCMHSLYWELFDATQLRLFCSHPWESEPAPCFKEWPHNPGIPLTTPHTGLSRVSPFSPTLTLQRGAAHHYPEGRNWGSHCVLSDSQLFFKSRCTITLITLQAWLINMVTDYYCCPTVNRNLRNFRGSTGLMEASSWIWTAMLSQSEPSSSLSLKLRV